MRNPGELALILSREVGYLPPSSALISSVLALKALMVVAALQNRHPNKMRAVSVANNDWQELWTEIQNVAAGATPDPKWASRSHLEGLTGGVYVRPTWPQLYHDVTVAAAAAATMRGLVAQQPQAAHAGGAKTLTDEFLLSGDGLEWTHTGLVLLRLKLYFCLGSFHPPSHLCPALF